MRHARKRHRRANDILLAVIGALSFCALMGMFGFIIAAVLVQY